MPLSAVHKSFVSVLIIGLIANGIFVATPVTNDVQPAIHLVSGRAPVISTDLGGTTLYWPFGKSIESGQNLTYSNGIIILNGSSSVAGGNLVIKRGGTLTLLNIKLKLNSTPIVRYRIEVQDGGVLNVETSNITTNRTSTQFLFWVERNATLNFSSSELHNCGYNIADLKSRGLWINGSNYVRIERSNFSYNLDAVRVLRGNIRITNCTFIKNNNAIILNRSSSLIYSNRLIENDNIALWLQEDCSVVEKNIISSNGVGIYATCSSSRIMRNDISSNLFEGVYANFSASTLVIKENNITNNGGGSNIIFYDAFETGAGGWSVTANEQIAPGWLTPSNPHWHLNPPAAFRRSHSPTHAWWFARDTDDPGSVWNEAGTLWNDTTGSNITGRLISPPITLSSSFQSIALVFWEWVNANPSDSYNQRWVTIREYGQTNWKNVLKLPQSPMQTWVKRTASLTPWIGKTIQLAFYMIVPSGDRAIQGGWYIDDVKLILGLRDITELYHNNGIYLNNSSPSIERNRIVGNANTGIYAEHSFAHINSNIIERNRYGLWLNFSSPVISFNSVSGNSRIGIFLTNRSVPNINNNTLSGNGREALWSERFSAPAIEYNEISQNGGGLVLSWCAGSVLKNNNITYNFGHGVVVSNGTLTCINNNFIYNYGYGLLTYPDARSNWVIDYSAGQRNASAIRNTVRVFGNISVRTGGKLYLESATVMFDSDGYTKNGFIIEAGGETRIIGCTFTASPSHYRAYRFEIKIGGVLSMLLSTVQYTDHVKIESSNVVIDSCRIENNYFDGLYIRNAAPRIVASTMRNNTNGAGIKCENAQPLIQDCTLFTNGHAALFATAGSRVQICTSRIQSNPIGIYAASSTVAAVNSTVSNNNYNFYLISGSSATLLNTTFDDNVVVFDSSQFEVKWFLDIRVMRTASIALPNVRVVVKDRFGTERVNLTTSSEGWVHSNLTHYIQYATATAVYTPHNVTVYNATIRRYADILLDRSSLLVLVLNSAPYITSLPVMHAKQAELYVYPVTAVDPDGDRLQYNLTERPAGMNINVTSGLITWYPGPTQIGENNVTVTVSDPYGGIACQKFKIRVENINDRPRLQKIQALLAIQDMLFSYQVNATDPDLPYGDTLTFLLIGAPSGMTIDSLTGLILWTPTNAQVTNSSYGIAKPPYAVRVVVRDLFNAYDNITFNISVLDSPERPKITSHPPNSAVQDESYVYQLNATDPDLMLGDRLSYAITSGPAGMKINSSSGLIYWVPRYDQIGTFNITVQVTDTTNLTDSQTFIITVANRNDAPWISAIPDTVLDEGTVFRYEVNATDPDLPYGDYLMFSLVTLPGSEMKIDAVTGIIFWTAVEGNYTVIITVTDSCGLHAATKFNLIVRGTNHAPSIASVSITPSAPTRNSTLIALPSGWYDADGDEENYFYQWQRFMDGKWVTIHGATNSTLRGSFIRDDMLRVQVIPWDGKLKGAAINSSPVIIHNSKPVITAVYILPANASANTSLSVSVKSYDADNDTIMLEYQWYRNGQKLHGAQSSTLTAGYFRKGDIMSCELIPFDGLDYGTARMSPSLLIRNTPPILKELTILPRNPTRKSVLRAVPQATDGDGDTIFYHYQWFVNGIPVPGAVSPTLENVFAKGDTVSCFVAPFDGEAHGVQRGANVTIINLPPALSNAMMVPASGDTETEFTFSVLYTDDDNDPGIVLLVLDTHEYQMTAKDTNYSSGVVYEHKQKLLPGRHIYYFIAKDPSDATCRSNLTSTPLIAEAIVETHAGLWIAVGTIAALILIFALVLYLPEIMPKKRAKVLVKPRRKITEKKMPPLKEIKKAVVIKPEKRVEPPELAKPKKVDVKAKKLKKLEKKKETGQIKVTELKEVLKKEMELPLQLEKEKKTKEQSCSICEGTIKDEPFVCEHCGTLMHQHCALTLRRCMVCHKPLVEKK